MDSLYRDSPRLLKYFPLQMFFAHAKRSFEFAWENYGFVMELIPTYFLSNRKISYYLFFVSPK